MDTKEIVLVSDESVHENGISSDLEKSERLEVPVSRANAIAFVLLRQIYSVNDEYDQEERRELTEFMNSFARQKFFSGTADDFHNFAVDLARRDEYSFACDVLEAGMKQGCYSRNCDLLADYLQYGISCGRVKQAKRYFKIMMNIPRRKWSWRSFSFGIPFIQFIDQQGEFDKNLKACLDTVDCSEIEGSGISQVERCVLALISEYKRYFPKREEPYLVESQFLSYLKEDEMAIKALQQAEELIPNSPKCSLRKADIMFERGNYDEACRSVQRALEGAVQTQSGVNEGYLHYLFALCYVANSRKNNVELNDEYVDAIYSHFDTALDEFKDGQSNYTDIIKRNARNVRKESKIDIDDRYSNLQSLLDE